MIKLPYEVFVEDDIANNLNNGTWYICEQSGRIKDSKTKQFVKAIQLFQTDSIDLTSSSLFPDTLLENPLELFSCGFSGPALISSAVGFAIIKRDLKKIKKQLERMDQKLDEINATTKRIERNQKIDFEKYYFSALAKIEDAEYSIHEQTKNSLFSSARNQLYEGIAVCDRGGADFNDLKYVSEVLLINIYLATGEFKIAQKRVRRLLEEHRTQLETTLANFTPTLHGGLKNNFLRMRAMFQSSNPEIESDFDRLQRKLKQCSNEHIIISSLPQSDRKVYLLGKLEEYIKLYQNDITEAKNNNSLGNFIQNLTERDNQKNKTSSNDISALVHWDGTPIQATEELLELEKHNKALRYLQNLSEQIDIMSEFQMGLEEYQSFLTAQAEKHGDNAYIHILHSS